MDLDLELIQFYRCSTLEALMQRAASTSALIGFPLIALTWTPAPGPDAVMIKNHVQVAGNYTDALGANGVALSNALADSMAIALEKTKTNTKACQTWQLTQRDTFKVFANAPSEFFLTAYQKELMQDFTAQVWTEFLAIPVCQERDRTLLFIAKTQAVLTEEMSTRIHRVLNTFASAYRVLYTTAVQQETRTSNHPYGDPLSSREVECLQWLASGKTLSEAATILGISERTLRYHISNARDRLGVATTVQAIVAAALTYGFDPQDPRRSICATSRPQTA